MKLGNVKWLVTDQQNSEPSMGEPIVDALGLNTDELIATAADRFAGSVDAQALIGWIDRQTEGRVSPIMDGVFHADEVQKVKEADADSEKWYDIG